MSAFITILLGLLGLSVVIFFHELGHFFMARLVGIPVLEFSIGMGPALVSFTRKNIRYKVGVFPVGGYCKLKGEDSYRNAILEKRETAVFEKDDFLGTNPFKKILISLGGPLFNLILAFLIFVFIQAIGYTTSTLPNRIILTNDFIDSPRYPALDAGLITGDVITQIDNTPTPSFSEIQKIVSQSAEKQLDLTVVRGTETLHITATPMLDKTSASGKLGIYPWVDPVVSKVRKASAAYVAGLEPGDKILSCNDIEIRNTQDIYAYFEKQQPEKCSILIERDGKQLSIVILPIYSADGNTDPLGISWATMKIRIQSKGFFAALSNGFGEVATVLSDTYKGIISLFSGANVLSAIAGPARITWTVGKITTEGIAEEGVSNGLLSTFNFLGFLSIALFVMNLLPIPVLDGGWILLFLIEIVRRKPVSLKAILRYQQIGLVVIFLLFGISIFSDILFFIKG